MVSDLQNTPNYTIPEAATYLNLPSDTLRKWVKGRFYRTADDPRKWSEPLIAIADPVQNLMSFSNLTEAHVLSALRRFHKVKMDKVRLALDYLKRSFQSERPLIEHNFWTDGKELFIHELNELVNLNRDGQLAITKALDAHLDRVIRDEQGRLLRLYPVGSFGVRGPRPVMIDPRIGFGNPVIAETRIPVDVIIGRYNAGDSLEELADDYRCETEQIENAILWKLAA